MKAVEYPNSVSQKPHHRNLQTINDDPLALASEVRSIMHDIKSTGVEIDIPLIPYVKEIYPTYSHYLESLQASGNLKEITFDSHENKFDERDKAFGKNTNPHSTKEVVCLAHKEKYHAQDSSRGRGRRNFRGKGGKKFQGEKFDLDCI